MAVAVLTLRLALQDAHSLKDKRRIVKSLKERIRQRFNVSVAEMDFQDVWQSAELGVCVISPDTRFAQSVASKVTDFVKADRRMYLSSTELEVF